MAIKEQIILEGKNKTQKAFNDVQKSMNRLETNTGKAGAAFSKLQRIIVGAVAAVGAFKLSKAFLDTAVEVENLSIQMKFLTGSAEKGAEAFDTLLKFAEGVPFQLQEIANSAPLLLTVTDNADELNQLLQITGDIAAATGLSFRQTAEQLQRTFSGGIAAADLFREKGVKSLLGFEEGVRFTAEESKKQILSMWEDGSAVMIGASAEMATTWTGTMSMIGDKWFKFKVALMDSGPFDFVKKIMKSLDSFIDKRFGTIEKAAEAMGMKIVDAMMAATVGLSKLGDMIEPVARIAFNSIKNLVNAVNELPATIKTIGLIGFLFLGTKGKVVVLGIGALIDDLEGKIGAMINKFADFNQSIVDWRKKWDPFITDEEIADIEKWNNSMKETAKRMTEPLEVDLPDAMDDVMIKFGDFGDVTEEEYGKMSDRTKALVDFWRELKEEMIAAKQASSTVVTKAPDWVTGGSKEDQEKAAAEALAQQEKMNKLMLLKKKTFQKMVTEAEAKEAKKQLFIHTEMNKKKLAFQQKVAEAEKAFNENRTTALESYVEGFKGQMAQQMTVFEQLQQAGANAFNSLADALTDFVMTGKFKFKDFANLVIRELVRIAVQAAITFAIKKAIGAMTGIPFLADGGPLKANQPAIVGEEGPELFVPKSSGNIIPNDELRGSGRGVAGGKEVTVNFTVNAIDSQSFSDTLAEQKDTIVGIINEAVTDSGRQPITA